MLLDGAATRTLFDSVIDGHRVPEEFRTGATAPAEEPAPGARAGAGAGAGPGRARGASRSRRPR